MYLMLDAGVGTQGAVVVVEEDEAEEEDIAEARKMISPQP